MSLFQRDTSVFIKPLGLIVEGQTISGPLSLEATSRSVYELVRDNLDVSSELMLRRKIIVQTQATVLITRAALSVQGEAGAIAYNEAQRAAAVKSVRDALGIKDLTEEPEEEEVPVKPRRGRRPKRVAEPEPVVPPVTDEEIEAMVDANLEYHSVAKTFALEEITIDTEVLIPFNQSEPYRLRAGNPKHEATINAKIAQVTNLTAKLHQRIGNMQNDLNGSAFPTALAATPFASDDLEDATTRRIDESALGNYRNSLTREVDELSNRIRHEYDWFDKNVVSYFNDQQVVTVVPFDSDDLVIADATFSRKTALSQVFSDILVPFDYRAYTDN